MCHWFLRTRVRFSLPQQLSTGLYGKGQISIIGVIIPIILEKSLNRYYCADMSDLSFKSISELQVLLGEQLRALRFSKELGQIATAEKAGISEKALRNLEAGRGSTVESFLRVLKALSSLDGLELLVPKPSVSPLALLRSSKARQRVRQPFASRHGNP
jgi:DNA-binding XRE family transcriptional regulator